MSSPDSRPDTVEPDPRFDRLGPYVIRGRLGRGAQGEVFLALDERVGREVALKVLPPALVASPQAVERFRREAAAAARVDHPGICTVFEADIDHGRPFIAMQRIDGVPLSRVLGDVEGWGPLGESSSAGDARRTALAGERGRAHVARMVHLVEQAARALHAAHESGLVHRDIKPSNLMVTGDDRPVLLDFGLASLDDSQTASLTATGALIGTPTYLPPELLAHRVEEPDPRQDVYSLGVTLYEAVTLRPPFEAPTRERLYHRILTTEPDDPRRVSPAVSRDLHVVLMTALEKDPDRRYPSARAFADDIGRLRRHEPVEARPPSALYRLSRWTRRNRALAASLAGVFTLLVAGLAVTGHLLKTTDDALEREQEASEAKDDALAALRAETAAKEAARRRAEDEARRVRALALANAAVHEIESDPAFAVWLANEAAGVDRLPAVAEAARATLAASAARVRFRGHTHDVLQARFLDGGRRVATFSRDGTVRVWSDDGTALAVLGATGPAIVAFAPFPDGQSFVTADREGRLRRHDRDGTVLDELPGTGDAVRQLDTDGRRRVVVVDRQGGVQLWHPRGGDPVSFAVEGVRFVAARFTLAPDTLLLLDDERRVHLWRPSANTAAIAAIRRRSSTFVLTPDGREGLVQREDEAFVAVGIDGDVRTLLPAVTGAVSAAAMAPDGDRFAVAVDDGPVQVHAADGTLIHTLEAHRDRVTRIVWSADGRRLLTVGQDHSCRIWDGDGAETAVLREGISPVYDAAFSPEGDRVLTAHGSMDALTWELGGGDHEVLRGHDGPVTAAFFGPGDRIVTAADDGRVVIHGRTEGPDVDVDAGVGPVTVAALDPGGRFVVVGGRTGAIALVDLQGTLRWRLDHAHRTAVTQAALSPDGTRLATAAGASRSLVLRPVTPRAPGEAVAIDLPAVLGERWPAPDRSLPIHDLAFTASGEGLAAALSSGVFLFDPEGRRRAAGPWGGYSYDLATHPHDDRVAAANSERFVRVLDRAGETIALLPGHGTRVRAVCWSPDGTRLLSGCDDGRARLWDASGELVASIPVGESRETVDDVRAVAFDGAGMRWAAASLSGRLIVRSVDGDEVLGIADAGGNVHTVAFAPDGHSVLVAGDGETVRLYPLDDASVLDRLSRRVTMRPSPAQRRRYADLLGGDPAIDAEAAVWMQDLQDGNGLRAEFRAAVESDPTRGPLVKRRTLELVDRVREDPERLNALAWQRARNAETEPEEIVHAVRWARQAVRVDPSSGFLLNTLGVALYRAGRFEEAYATLLRSDTLNRELRQFRDGHPADSAFLALGAHALGRTEDALRHRADLVRQAARAIHANDPDVAAFVAEVEAAMGKGTD